MRRILVEQARREGRVNHGGDPAREPEVPSLDEAIDRLASSNPWTADLVKPRYFAGLTNAEAAALLGVSPRKANQVWAWLREELGDEE